MSAARADTPVMRRALVLVSASVLLVPALAAGKASHAGWPKISPKHLHMNTKDVSPWTTRGTSASDEILGGHGDDRLYGNGASDVLWGDHKPSGQGTGQSDVLDGGAGRDFLYASHGRNAILGGAGNDVVHAHFGRGSIDCGSGSDLVILSRRSQRIYRVTHCETVSFRLERR